jgi:hypothetical protein
MRGSAVNLIVVFIFIETGVSHGRDDAIDQRPEFQHRMWRRVCDPPRFGRTKTAGFELVNRRQISKTRLLRSPMRYVFNFFLLSLTPAQAAPPNLVVLLADDAGWGDYCFSGNSQVAMPNIDSIAKGGVSLDLFFVCPVCSPTRAEFLTGRCHPRTGVKGVSTGHERLDLDEKTIADAFSAAGYATGAFGKWHNGSRWPYHPMARGFDTYFGHSAGHWGEYFDAPLEIPGKTVMDLRRLTLTLK